MVEAALIVPTLNAGSMWKVWLEAFDAQSWKPERVLVIDSSSTDDTAKIARRFGLDVRVIPKESFNHGGTRAQGIEWAGKPELAFYLTQDAILADNHGLEKLRQALTRDDVGAVYGRQIPHTNASPIGAHARLFNYPGISEVRSFEDRSNKGIKTAFLSNSFAAYRVAALKAVGGFPTTTLVNEDTYVAGKMLLAGWKISYCADAMVHHSHDYGFLEEFHRYFDVGVFHAQQEWLRESFGNAEGEGVRFVVSELKYLLRCAPGLIPSTMIRTVMRWLGYRIGIAHTKLPVQVKRKLSSHQNYW